MIFEFVVAPEPNEIIEGDSEPRPDERGPVGETNPNTSADVPCALDSGKSPASATRVKSTRDVTCTRGMDMQRTVLQRPGRHIRDQTG